MRSSALLPKTIMDALARPWVLIVLVHVGLFDIACIASRWPTIDTPASSFLHDACTTGRRCGSRGIVPNISTSLWTTVYRLPDGTLTSNLPFVPPDQLSQCTPTNAVDSVIIHRTSGKLGWYVPTFKGERIRVYSANSLLPMSTPFHPHTTLIMNRLSSETLFFSPPLTSSERRTLLATGRLSRGHTLWLGWLHNAWALLLAIAIPVSITANLDRARRWFIASRRTERQECPHCRYSTVGLTTNTCPECGERFSNTD